VLAFIEPAAEVPGVRLELQVADAERVEPARLG